MKIPITTAPESIKWKCATTYKLSCMDMFKLTCDNHIPVKPATRKNKINDMIPSRIRLFFIIPLTNVYVQLTTLIVAGSEIIIVIVLYSDLLL
jgi:hypothetical protein